MRTVDIGISHDYYLVVTKLRNVKIIPVTFGKPASEGIYHGLHLGVAEYFIYGGFLYMFSSGDSGKAANSRKVLTRAFIGLAIILLSNVILNSIRFALIQNGSFTSIKGQPSPEDIFFNGIKWVIGISVVVCLIFIVIGAIGYITSAGDPQKLQKAKNTLMYALIGLAIVALSAIIKEFVYNLITSSKEGAGLINQTIIAKESYEK